MPHNIIEEFDGENWAVGKDFKSMIPDTADITLEDVKNAIISIRVSGSYSAFPLEFESDDLQLSYSLQRVCYQAGKNHNYFNVIPVTLLDIYVAAVRLSLQAEGNGRLWPPPGVPGARPGRYPGRYPGRRSKPCCDCCGCDCHSKVVPRVVPPPGWNLSRARPPIRADIVDAVSVSRRRSRFGWLSKLCFWRRKSSDLESVSSSASSTIVD
jgi:hypothetical protein